MRTKVSAAVLLAVLLIGSVAVATAAASPAGTIVGGLQTYDSKLEPFVYAEARIQDNLTLGLEYYHSIFGLSVWIGGDRGWYGELNSNGNMSPSAQSIEVGAWRDLNLSGQLRVTGWAGINLDFAGSGSTGLSLSAEAQVPINAMVYAVGGGTIVFAQNTSNTKGWIGVGLDF